jgi:hypothetical protein
MVPSASTGAGGAESRGAADYALDALDKATAVRTSGSVAGTGSDRRGITSALGDLPGLDFSFSAPSFLSGRSRWALFCVLAAGGFVSLWIAYRMAVEAPAGHGAEWVAPPVFGLVVAAVAFALAYATVMGFGKVTLTTKVGPGVGAGPDQAASGPPAPPDAPAIGVSTVMPPDGATGVPVSAAVLARFSAALSAGTVSQTAFTLRKQGAADPMPATVTVDPDGTTARLVPASPLDPGSAYEAHVAGSVQDALGRSLGSPKVWTFTTAPAPGARAER